MDSKAINNLIRSDVWPLLRSQGFTTFEARSAFRYRDPFIDIVNFQSFNKILAERVGCTTFSFALNLGVYVVGSSREDRVKRDKHGRLLPREYECCFRTQLQKRSPVDGFQRSDIFYFDVAGKSVAACFDEVTYLLSEVAPVWFDSYSDLNQLISRAESSSNGSFASNDRLATLRRAVHRKSPTSETGSALFRQVEVLIGSYLDLPLTLATAITTEREVLRVRDLIASLGDESSFPLPSAPVTRSWLFGSAWTSTVPGCPNQTPSPVSHDLKHTIRQEIWPMLKRIGFSEFSGSLAHRNIGRAIEVVELAPVDRGDRTLPELPADGFEIGLGVYWPLLMEKRLVGMNSSGLPRPKLRECHIFTWLLPQQPAVPFPRSTFFLSSDAQECIRGEGMSWLSTFSQPVIALPLLKQRNWEIFSTNPMVRSIGSRASTKRLLLLFALAQLLDLKAEAQKYLIQARAAIERYPKHLRLRFYDWLDGIDPQMSGSITPVS